MQLGVGTIVERYVIEGLLGRGGFAAVYRARHRQLGTLHAIKVLLVQDEEIRERLLLEGRLQARLRHPNIVSVGDVIDVNGQPALVMELVEGRSLDQVLRGPRMSIREADLIARGVLGAVAEAHKLGLVHRDLKPHNVILAVDGDQIVPKVTDFGIAKVLDGGELPAVTRTRTGMTLGTPCYMAPEQIRNTKGVDQRADVFACGAILYELLAGERAFPQETLPDLFGAILSGRYEPLRNVRDDVPEHMVRAIDKALSVDPIARFANGRELLDAWVGSQDAVVRDRPWSDGLLRRATAGDPPEEAPRGELSASTIDTTSPSGSGPIPGTVWERNGPAAREPMAVTPVADGASPPAASAGAPSRTGLFAALATAGVAAIVLMGLLGVGALGAGAWWAGAGSSVEPPGPDPVLTPPPVREPEPPGPGDTDAASTQAGEADPPPAPLPAPKPKPQKQPIPATPEPSQQAVQVRLTGDQASVKLVKTGHEYPVPGAVPPGDYMIVALFPGQSEPIGGNTVTIGDQPVDIRCTKGFLTCTAR